MLRKCDNVFSTQRFTILYFTTVYYNRFAVTRDHLIGCLARLACPFRNMHEQITWCACVHIWPYAARTRSPGILRAINAIVFKRSPVLAANAIGESVSLCQPSFSYRSPTPAALPLNSTADQLWKFSFISCSTIDHQQLCNLPWLLTVSLIVDLSTALVLICRGVWMDVSWSTETVFTFQLP